jgi:hypothetical protein
MDSNQSNSDPLALAELGEKWEVQEPEFTSATPVFGPLIVRVRRAWNSIATKWYVRAIVQQQNELNYQLFQRLADADARLAEMDRDLSAAIHDMGELAAQVVQLERRLNALEAQMGPAREQPEAQAGADAQAGLY